MQDEFLREKIRRLEKELSHRDMEIALFQEVADLIASGLDLSTLYARVAERTRELIGAETLLIPIVDKDRLTYTYQAAAGHYADEIVGQTLPMEAGACGWVLQNRCAYWHGEPCFPGRPTEPNRWERSAGALILVPLMGKQRVLGGLSAINKQGHERFEQRDFELLKLFAKQVSLAIENAMVLQELHEARQRADAYRDELEVSNERLTRVNEDLHTLAVHDALTGLPNRTLIMDRLRHGLVNARRNQESMALLMIDLNQFKEVNDTLGHQIGDRLLTCIGQRFQNALREGDTLGRLGGDEFAVVVPKAGREAAVQIANSLQRALNSPVSIDNHGFNVGASIGIALFPGDGADAGALLRCADVAMYTSKRGQEPYAFYHEELDQADTNRLVVLGDLRETIVNDDFYIALQPVLDLPTETLTGVEVLARWKYDNYDGTSPADFVPLLEGSGMVRAFTLQILEKALCEYAALQTLGYDLNVALNLTMSDLTDDKLPELIRVRLENHSVPASALTLEVSENTIMRNTERSLPTLNRLGELGIVLSVDDFGTGYSSLGQLKRLPIRQLKIDRSLVSHMVARKDDAMLVETTIGLAHNLGLTAVAEGVETLETLRMLKLAGCDAAQGFFISQPLRSGQLANFLKVQTWKVQSRRDGPDLTSQGGY